MDQPIHLWLVWKEAPGYSGRPKNNNNITISQVCESLRCIIIIVLSASAEGKGHPRCSPEIGHGFTHVFFKVLVILDKEHGQFVIDILGLFKNIFGHFWFFKQA